MDTKTLIVHGTSDDLVDFFGVAHAEFGTSYANWYGVVTDANGEYIRLHISYGEEGVEWKLRLENPFNWDVEVGEREGYEPDPALFIETPTGEVEIDELDELWENPQFTTIAV